MPKSSCKDTQAAVAALPDTALTNEAFRLRLQYLLHTVFFGDPAYAADKLGVSTLFVRRVLFGERKVTVSFLARVALRLGVRTDWLLFGTGPMFDYAVHGKVADGAVRLPLVVQSSFPCFAAADEVSPEHEFCGPPGWRAVDEQTDDTPEAYFAAAKAVYTAHIAKSPFGFFLGCEGAAQNIFEPVLTLFKTYGAQFLLTTLSAVRRDAQQIVCDLPGDVSLSQIARIAANRGVGYGEAFALWAQTGRADQSLLSALYKRGQPASVLVDFGEIFEHVAAPVRGADLGAATGAAAYVDFLIATKQFEQFFHTTEGVICVAGEEERALRFVYRQAAFFQNRSARFTAIIFAPPSARLAALVSGCGGTPIFLPHDYGPALTRFLDACSQVYAGQTP